MDFTVLFEDNHLLIVDKKAGIPTQVSEHHEKALETSLKEFLKEKYQKKGDVFLHAVHRIDKDVSGIVIFAKTSKALSRMQEILRENQMEKTYLALVENTFKEKKQTLSHFLIKLSHKAKIVLKEEPDAKKVELSFEVLEEKNNTALLLIRLHTGRYHQIRAQLSFTNHPIIGDTKYGSTKKTKDGRIFLRNIEVAFPHIITKEKIVVSLPRTFPE